jgi:hypothetical protein
MSPFDPSKFIKQTLSGSHYGFSGTRIDDLGAAEYTLVTIVCDQSGSVSGFRTEIEACIDQIVKACQRSPRADNLMLRLVSFDSTLSEVHGFKPIMECSPADYQHFLQCGGCTALYDASVNAVSALSAYGQDLVDHGFSANGIVFVVTDGEDNTSNATAKTVRDVLTQGVSGEHLESLLSVLVGVNVGSGPVSAGLMDFSAKAGFTEYIEIAKANTSTLAGLARFASRSIAAQSVMLGSGKSASLSF